MKNKNKGKYAVMILSLLTLVSSLCLMPVFVPTANAINIKGDFSSPNALDPFQKLKGDIPVSENEVMKIDSLDSSELQSNSLEEKASEILAKEKEELERIREEQKENQNTISNKKESDIEDENVETLDLENYETSLEKIKENYNEIQNEINKLEEIKKHIEETNLKNKKTKEELSEIEKKLDSLKAESQKQKTQIPFYTFLTSLNIVGLAIIFIFSRNAKTKMKQKNWYLN